MLIPILAILGIVFSILITCWTTHHSERWWDSPN